MGEYQDDTSGSPYGAKPGAFGLGSRVVMGFVLAVALVASVGGWALTAKVSGAVITPGTVVIDDNMKLLQHRDGGIVSEIAVKEGDTVEMGQILLRLDDVQTKAELSIVQSQTMELIARRTRLVAERDGLGMIQYPEGYNDLPGTKEFTAGEMRLFNGRLASRESQKQQLELGVEQIGDEITGLQSQRSAKADEIALIKVENDRMDALNSQGLIESTRLHSIRREVIRLRGELGEIDAQIARARARTNEIHLQILSVDRNAQTEAQSELSAADTKLQELEERSLALRDKLSRTDIRAPLAGTVNELHVHTLGGVITPAQVVVTIVPTGSKLSISIRISPLSIEQVSLGTPARLLFPTFNRRTTPEIQGRISYVSSANAEDPATGEKYFQGRVEVSAEELAKLGDSALLPGMPVEVFVQTEDRTVASYLVRPIMDQFNRAFRER